MASRPIVFARLMAAEQAAIGLLREDDGYDIGLGGRRDFAWLRREARKAGMSLLPPGSRYLGPDEIRLLAWLTLLQRQQADVEIDADPALRETLVRCAVRLDCLGARLDYRNVTRDCGEQPAIRPARMIRKDTSIAPRPDRLQPLIARSPLQARALLFASERGVVPVREFIRIGISRQIINRMSRRGLLDRVGFGEYAVACDAPDRPC